MWPFKRAPAPSAPVPPPMKEMMMSSPTPVTPAPLTGQNILSILENDVLLAAGQPLLTFLANAAEAKGNVVALALYWQQLVGDLTGSLPNLEATVAQQITAALQAKLQALLAQANAQQLAAAAIKAKVS